jgi:hypothetical protein
MSSSIVSMPGSSTRAERPELPSHNWDREELVETPECRNRSGRGVLAGLLLGAGMWAAILACTGIIKL